MPSDKTQIFALSDKVNWIFVSWSALPSPICQPQKGDVIMPTYTIRSQKLTCPSCSSVVKTGNLPRFGPARATCHRCKTTFLTGLSTWHDLSLAEKLWAGIAEIIAPSFIGPFFPALLINLLVIVLFGACGMSFVIVPNSNATEGAVTNGAIVGLLIWPVFLVVRLIWMVLASYRYSKQGVPPIW
jgi:hypothetical protein